MAKGPKIPTTPAIRLLRQHHAEFEAHVCDYVEKGGTAHSSAALGVPEHQVIKTLVMQDDGAQPLLVLMHGDRQVSTRSLARHIGARSITPCTPNVAAKHTGYQVGGTSPLGTRKSLPVYAESSVFELERIYINGGKRGLLVSLPPAELERVLEVERVHVAQAE